MVRDDGLDRLTRTLEVLERRDRRDRRRGPWWWRAFTWCLRLAGRTAAFGARRGLRHRRKLAPLYVAAALFAAGETVHHIPGPLQNAAVIAAVAGAVLAGWQHRAHRNRKLIYRSGPAVRRYRKLIYGWVLYLPAAGWLLGACVVDPAAPPMPGLWLFWTLAAAIPWWLHWRVRSKPEDDTTEVVAAWTEYVAADGGVAPAAVLYPPTVLYEPEPEPGRAPAVIGWTAEGEVPKGKTAAKHVVTRTEEIAGVWDSNAADVQIEAATSGSNRSFTVTCYTANPLMQVREWPGPEHLYDPATGIANIAFRADGTLAPYRMYRPGSGPVHDLISGVTDAGKSRVVDQLLAIERAAGYISIILDPQFGQSLPEWKRQVALFARGTEECVAGLAAVQQEMFSRNKLLSDVEWTEVVDGEERRHEGIDFFDPDHPVIKQLGLKLMCLTVEEAHNLTKDPRCLAMLESIATMARKCGIKLRLITQLPLLEQLGSQTLRSMVAAGNVIIFRTADRLSGDVAFNGNLPADPATLPREWPDGSTTAGLCYVLGPRARAVPARTWFVRDVWRWAHEGDTIEALEVRAVFVALVETLNGAEPSAALVAGFKATGVVPLSAPGDGASVATIAAEQVDTAATGAGVRQRIAAYFSATDDQGRYIHDAATTGTIAGELDLLSNTVSQTCRRMADRGEIEDWGHSMWARPGLKRYTMPAEMAAA